MIGAAESVSPSMAGPALRKLTVYEEERHGDHFTEA